MSGTLFRIGSIEPSKLFICQSRVGNFFALLDNGHATTSFRTISELLKNLDEFNEELHYNKCNDRNVLSNIQKEIYEVHHSPYEAMYRIVKEIDLPRMIDAVALHYPEEFI